MAHLRIGLLCQRKFPIEFDTSLTQAGLAFPIVVYTHLLEDNSRKIMDISECEVTSSGQRRYHTLYRYHTISNQFINGFYQIEGYFTKVDCMSDSLRKKLIQYGIPQEVLRRFLQKEGSA